MTMSLAGKTVLVTGASSGIGRAMALYLADAGAKVALVGRSQERLGEVARKIGANALALPADLTQPGAVEDVVSKAIAHFGVLDIVLPNAGIYVPGQVSEGDPDAWDEMIRINVSSVFRLVRAVLPHMIARGQGDIVITSSVSGHEAIHWEPIYSASKHAIQAFVRTVRRQVAPQGIRLGAVAPGVVLNELWGQTDPDAIAKKVAAREGILSEDVADAVLYMVTRPRHVTIRDLVILPQNQDI